MKTSVCNNTINVAIFYHSDIDNQPIIQALEKEAFNVLTNVAFSQIKLKDFTPSSFQLLLLNVDLIDSQVQETIAQIHTCFEIPMVIFSKHHCNLSEETLVNSGVYSVIEGDIPMPRLANVLRHALARAKVYSGMRKELNKTKARLANIKIVEQAKLCLMTNQKLTEQQAYQLIRKTAMDTSSKIEEVAKNIIVIQEGIAKASSQ